MRFGDGQLDESRCCRRPVRSGVLGNRASTQSGALFANKALEASTESTVLARPLRTSLVCSRHPAVE